MVFNIVFGIIFMATGLFSFILTAIIYFFVESEFFLIPFGFLFLIVFGGIGFGVFWIGLKKILKKKKIIREGESYLAKIIDYEDNTTEYRNGMPLLDLVVLFEMSGITKIARLGTNSTDVNKYPINSIVEVSVLNNQIVLK